MAGMRVGPLYGPLPDIDPAWQLLASDNVTVIFDGEDLRELIRDNLGLNTSYSELHKLSQCMNSAAAVSTRAVTSIVADIKRIEDLRLKVETLKQADPQNPTSLPLIKADVVEYSEEPLKRGKNPLAISLQPLEEEIARLGMKICISLDMGAWDLGGPCNDTGRWSPGIIRS